MRQSFEEYLNSSGRLIYMGGNGFYWKIAFSDSLPGVMEVRKAETTDQHQLRRYRPAG
ncbi:hypothetical protein SANTM175S_03520 [Streptomyces antimycoticus]